VNHPIRARRLDRPDRPAAPAPGSPPPGIHRERRGDHGRVRPCGEDALTVPVGGQRPPPCAGPLPRIPSGRCDRKIPLGNEGLRAPRCPPAASLAQARCRSCRSGAAPRKPGCIAGGTRRLRPVPAGPGLCAGQRGGRATYRAQHGRARPRPPADQALAGLGGKARSTTSTAPGASG